MEVREATEVETHELKEPLPPGGDVTTPLEEGEEPEHVPPGPALEPETPIRGTAVARISEGAKREALEKVQAFNNLVELDPNKALEIAKNRLKFQVELAKAIMDAKKELLKPGDTYRIKGSKRDSLGVRGAEVIASTSHLANDEPKIVKEEEDFERIFWCCPEHKELGLGTLGRVRYVYRITVRDVNTGFVKAVHDGEASSMEEKFAHESYYESELPDRYKALKEKLPQYTWDYRNKDGQLKEGKKYVVPISNVYDIANNVRARAQKRAYVPAIKEASGLGELFEESKEEKPRKQEASGRKSEGKISGGQISALNEKLVENGWLDNPAAKPKPRFYEVLKQNFGYASRSDIEEAKFADLMMLFSKKMTAAAPPAPTASPAAKPAVATSPAPAAKPSAAAPAKASGPPAGTKQPADDPTLKLITPIQRQTVEALCEGVPPEIVANLLEKYGYDVDKLTWGRANGLIAELNDARNKAATRV